MLHFPSFGGKTAVSLSAGLHSLFFSERFDSGKEKTPFGALNSLPLTPFGVIEVLHVLVWFSEKQKKNPKNKNTKTPITFKF